MLPPALVTQYACFTCNRRWVLQSSVGVAAWIATPQLLRRACICLGRTLLCKINVRLYRRKAEENRKERKTRKRNLALLSFGEQAEEEEQHLASAAAAGGKIKSAHEVLRGDAKLLAPEETPEEVLAEQQARAAALRGVQDKLRGATVSVVA